MKTVSASQHHNRAVLPGAAMLSGAGRVTQPVIRTPISVVLVFQSAQQGAVLLSVVVIVTPPVISIAISVVLVSPLHHHNVQQGARKLSGVVTVTQPAANTMIYVGSVYHLLRRLLSQHVLQNVPKLFRQVTVTSLALPTPVSVVNVSHHHHNAQRGA